MKRRGPPSSVVSLASAARWSLPRALVTRRLKVSRNFAPTSPPQRSINMAVSSFEYQMSKLPIVANSRMASR